MARWQQVKKGIALNNIGAIPLIFDIGETFKYLR